MGKFSIVDTTSVMRVCIGSGIPEHTIDIFSENGTRVGYASYDTIFRWSIWDSVKTLQTIQRLFETAYLQNKF